VLFWIIAGVLSIGLALVIWLVVLRSGGGASRPTAAYDLDLYRDQLKELERDIARGVISEAEAERARLEISRRILEADRALQRAQGAQGGPNLPIAVALLVTLGFGYVTYAMIGAPGYPDVPLAARIDIIEDLRANRPSQAEAEATAEAFPAPELPLEQAAELEALRAATADGGDDFEAWLLLARSEARARNYIAAHTAQSRALGLMGPRANAAAWTDLARMRILAAGGYVSPEAEAALNQALAIDPTQGDARFLLGAMYQRQDRPDLAFAIWRDLLADSTAGAPWVPPILDQIEEVAFFAGQRVDMETIALRLGASGPTQDQVEAAAEMSPEERMAMIEQMVAGLNDRLASEGGPAEDWARLISAYGVLGRYNEARAILREARVVFGDDLQAQSLLDAAETNLPQAAE